MSKFIEKLLKHGELLGFCLIFLIALFIYKDVFFQGKVVFSSNFLAQFYSPWSTVKFKGWEVGIPHKPTGSDSIRAFYPDRTIINESFNDGSFPLWNPYVFAGSPLLANFHSGVFYPLHFIYFLLPQITSWSFLIFSQPVLATFFSYLYLRKLGLRKISAFFGAFAFGFSNSVINWSQENPTVSRTIIWLPLILYSIESFIKTRKLKYFITSIFALATSFFAGFFQITFYIYFFSCLYGFVRILQIDYKRKISLFFIFITIFILALSLSAIQLFPSLEAYSNSPRPVSAASYLFDIYLLPITHIVNVLIPDIFGSMGSYNFFGRANYHETVVSIGAISFIFALLAMLSRKKNGIITFFIVITLSTFFLTINNPITKLFYSFQIPLFSTFLPSRILLITTFSLSVLSAFGIEIFLNDKEKKIKVINYVFLITFFIIISGVIYSFLLQKIDYQLLKPIHEYIIKPNYFPRIDYPGIILKNSFFVLILAFSAFIFVKLKINKNLSVLIIGALILFSQFYYLNKQLVLGYPQFLYPQHPIFSFLKNDFILDRFIVFGKPVLGNIWEQKMLYSPEGMDPMYSARYGQLAFAAQNSGKLTISDVPRIEVTFSELKDKETILSNYRRLKLLSFLGVKFFFYYTDKDLQLSINEIFPQEKFSVVKQIGNWYILENKDVLSRAYLVDNYVIEKDQQKILNTFFNKDFDISNNVILEEKPDLDTSSKKEEKSVRVAKITKYTAGEIKVLVNTDKNRILLLSDNYYPGWRAHIDGQPVKLYRANYSFRAMPVQKGKHEIVFNYKPTSFLIGIIISIISFVLILAVPLYLIISKKKF